jgi:phospholipid transport system substrate-binding protein
MPKRHHFLRIIAVAGLIALVASPGWAGTPTDQLHPAIDQVLRILTDPALKRSAKREVRRAALRRAVEPVFDFTETARLALGRYWRDRTPREREKFTALFTDLLEETYASRIEAYAGERVVYLGESVDGDYATVRTKIITKRDTEVPVDYRMRREGDRWRVYDVIIANVSLVDNYRSQFSDIIETSSLRALVERMHARLRELSATAG